jgi:hypothetical protein
MLELAMGETSASCRGETDTTGAPVDNSTRPLV